MVEYVTGGRRVAAGRALEWIPAGWELYKKQVGMWIVLGVLTFALFFVPVFIPIVGAVISILVRPLVAAGVLVAARTVDEGQELQVEHLFAGFRTKLVPLATIGATVLAAELPFMLLAAHLTGVSVLAMVGYGVEAGDLWLALRVLLAFMIVRVLMLPMALAATFAPALVMFHDKKAWVAMKESFAGCVLNILPLVVYFLISLLLGLIAVLTCGLGWLVLWPVLCSAYYVSYKDIYFRGGWNAAEAQTR